MSKHIHNLQWVWLRGFGQCAAHWGRFPERAREAGASPIISLDLPGFGERSHIHCPSTIDEVVDGLQGELVGRINQEQPLALLGQSFGGQVAMHWAASDPRVRALMMINSSSPLSPILHRLRPSALCALLVHAVKKPLGVSDALERHLLKRVSHRMDEHEAHRLMWRRVAQVYPVQYRQVIRQLRLAVTSALPSSEALSHCRTLVVASEADRLVRMSCSERLATYWCSDLWVHPDSGHELALDDPDWLLERILALESSLLSSSFRQKKAIEASLATAIVVDE